MKPPKLIEIAPGKWKKRGTLSPQELVRAEQIFSEKCHLLTEMGELIERIAKQAESPQLTEQRLPERLRRCEGDTSALWDAYIIAPIALAVVSEEKRQIEAILAELDG